MIGTGNIGNGTGPYRGDIVKKDMKSKGKVKVKAHPIKSKAVIAEVKTALKEHRPMIVAIARPKKK